MNEQIQLGNGAIESIPSTLDVVATASPINQTSFQADYTVIHDNQRGVGICTMAQIADVLYQIYGVEVSEQFGYVGGKRTYDKNMYEGSSIKTMLEYARVVGLPKKSLVPTDSTFKSYADYVNVQFTPEAYADAGNQKLPGYYKINDLSLQSLINEGAKSKFGISIMIRVGNNWYTAKSGYSSWNKEDLELLRSGKPYTGAHATKIAKLDNTGAGYIRNSWGDKQNPINRNGTGIWCDNGDIHFNYNEIKDDIVEAWGFLNAPISEKYTHRFTKSILYGQTSTEVTALHRVLAGLGYAQPITGYYGSITAKNVMQFQRDNNVASEEVIKELKGHNIGPSTRNALNLKQGV